MTRASVTALVLAIAFAFQTSAVNRHVPSDYPTIQAAINDCGPKDVVVVADGVWTAPGFYNLDFMGKDIVVRSSGGASKCIIDCQGVPGRRGVQFVTNEPPTARFCGFTIRNGSMTSGTAGNDGGGILVNTGRPIIDRCIIEDCTASAGGGIAVRNGSIVIFNCIIRRCIANGNTPGSAAGGGGITMDLIAPSLIVLTLIEDNMATSTTSPLGAAYGGGVLVYGTGPLIVRAGTIRRNHVRSVGADSFCEGGGIHAGTFALTRIEGCRISDNKASSLPIRLKGYGGGIYTIGNTVISQTLLEGNVADEFGGGICPLYRTVTVRECIIRNNRAANGGGIGCDYEAGTLTVASTLITDNNAANGGGVWMDTAARYSSCTIARNSATNAGGGVYVGRSGCNLSNSVVWDNTALVGKQIRSTTGALSVRHCAYPIGAGETTGVGLTTGSVYTNPLFVNPLGSNFRLSGGSPCIDSGNNSLLPSGIPWDLDGAGRMADDPAVVDTGAGASPIIDMGAYERFGSLRWESQATTGVAATN